MDEIGILHIDLDSFSSLLICEEVEVLKLIKLLLNKNKNI